MQSASPRTQFHEHHKREFYERWLNKIHEYIESRHYCTILSRKSTFASYCKIAAPKWSERSFHFPLQAFLQSTNCLSFALKTRSQLSTFHSVRSREILISLVPLYALFPHSNHVKHFRPSPPAATVNTTNSQINSSCFCSLHTYTHSHTHTHMCTRMCTLMWRTGSQLG